MSEQLTSILKFYFKIPGLLLFIIMKNINQEKDIIHFWLDHLEVFWTFKSESEYFTKLDFDNSNYSEFGDYVFTKNEVNPYKYKIIFNKWDYSLFAYYKWDDSQNIPTKDYIVIYSTVFIILTYEEILYFLQANFNLKRCIRFDICIDLLVDINDFLKNIDNVKTSRIYKKSGKIEIYYIWEVKNGLNKRQLIRIYNKKLDLTQKKKFNLYKDYFTYDNITRIELEVRAELANNRNYEDVFDDSLLIGIFKNYLYKYTKIFEEISWDKTTLFKTKQKFDPEKYQSLYYKKQRKNIFLWHDRTIYNMWFCPVRILLAEWYITQKIKQALWYIRVENLINQEKRIMWLARDNKELILNSNDIFSNDFEDDWK